VLAERPEQTLAIASHGTVISLFVADRAGVDGHALWQRLGQPDAVVLELPTFALVES
jgi:broad specificity phosphatase PhoE